MKFLIFCRAGVSDVKVTAAAAIKKRRDYGANPQGLPMSKREERLLSESSRALQGLTAQQQQQQQPQPQLEYDSCGEEQPGGESFQCDMGADYLGVLPKAEEPMHRKQGLQGRQTYMPGTMSEDVNRQPSHAAESAQTAAGAPTVRSVSDPLPRNDSMRQCNSASRSPAELRSSQRGTASCEPGIGATQNGLLQCEGYAAAETDPNPGLGRRGTSGCQVSLQSTVGGDGSKQMRCALVQASVSEDELRRMELLCSQGAASSGLSNLASTNYVSEQELSDMQVALRLQQEEFRLHKLRQQPMAPLVAGKRKLAGKVNTLDAFVRRKPNL